MLFMIVGVLNSEQKRPPPRGLFRGLSSCHKHPEPTQCSKAGPSSPQPGSLEAAVAHAGPSAQCPPPPAQGANTRASSKKEDGLEETNRPSDVSLGL